MRSASQIYKEQMRRYKSIEPIDETVFNSKIISINDVIKIYSYIFGDSPQSIESICKFMQVAKSIVGDYVYAQFDPLNRIHGLTKDVDVKTKSAWDAVIESATPKVAQAHTTPKTIAKNQFAEVQQLLDEDFNTYYVVFAPNETLELYSWSKVEDEIDRNHICAIWDSPEIPVPKSDRIKIFENRDDYDAYLSAAVQEKTVWFGSTDAITSFTATANITSKFTQRQPICNRCGSTDIRI